MQYLKQLGARAGHEIDLTRFERDSWIAASITSTRGDYTTMQAAILAGMPERKPD